jgi:hypothetical protein
MAHHHTPSPDVREVAPAAPPALAGAITRALAKDPGARFASAAAMRGALRGGTAVAPVAAPHPSATPSPRRSPRWWWAAAGVLLVVGVAIAALAARDANPGADAGVTTDPSVGVAPATTASPPSTAAPSTAGATTTTPVPTTSVTVATATLPPDAESVEQLLAAIGATDQLGPRRDELVRALERIGDGGGRADAQRARRVLEDARTWTERGELDPEVLASLEAVLEPLAAEEQPRRGNDRSGDEDGGGDDD